MSHKNLRHPSTTADTIGTRTSHTVAHAYTDRQLQPRCAETKVAELRRVNTLEGADIDFEETKRDT